jgi:transcriptional regulator with XRE-family HTH domain
MNYRRSYRLPDKLRAIRLKLELSEAELLERLDVEEGLTAEHIAAFEAGSSEPPLLVLLAIAKVAGVCTDVLIDDRRRLPRRLPAKMKC